MSLNPKDWIVVSGAHHPRQITEIHYDENGAIVGVFCDREYYTSDVFSKWEPKNQELCWFWNLNKNERNRHPILAKFDAKYSSPYRKQIFSCYSRILIGEPYSGKAISTNEFDYCEPFTDKPPTWFENN